MPYDGSSPDEQYSGVPIALILELQGLGWTSGRIARRIGKNPATVRSAAQRAGSPFSLTREMVFSPVPYRAASDRLLAAMRELPPDRCAFIAAEPDDPAARLCGESCCVSQVKGALPTRSAWCLEHHLVVYSPAANEKVKRRVYEEE